MDEAEKEEEVVGAIVEPTTPIPDPPRDESIHDDSVADSEDEYSIDEDDDQANISRVLVMIDSNYNEDDNRFDLEAKKERNKELCGLPGSTQ